MCFVVLEMENLRIFAFKITVTIPMNVHLVRPKVVAKSLKVYTANRKTNLEINLFRTPRLKVEKTKLKIPELPRKDEMV